MIASRSPRLMGGLILAFFLSACSVLDKQPQKAVDFGAAGSAYTKAISPLIDTYFAVRVDANSIELLGTIERFDLSRDEDKKLVRSTFKNNDKILIAEYSTLRQIKNHNALLMRYFQALSEFANDDSSQGIKKELDGLATSVETLGTQLDIDAVAVDAETKKKISQVTSLVVNVAVAAFKNIELRDHLKAYAQTIEDELAIQERFVIWLSSQLQEQSELIYRATTQEKIYQDLVDGKVDVNWRKRRIAHVTRVAQVDNAATNAQNAASAMRRKWAAFVGGDLAPGSLTELTQLIVEFVQSVREVKEIFVPAQNENSTGNNPAVVQPS